MDTGLINVDLPPGTVWSDMLFVGPWQANTVYTLNWLNTPAPLVIPEPGTFALLSLGLAGLGVVGGRSRRA